MKHVLLVASPVADAPNAVAYALRRAREIGGQLLALTVLDPALTHRVAQTLDTTGLVGERVSDTVVDALAREQHVHAESLLNQIAEQAKREGVAFTALIEEGDPADICRRIIETHDVQCAVLVAEKRSWLTRLLGHTAAIELPVRAGCEVKVMED